MLYENLRESLQSELGNILTFLKATTNFTTADHEKRIECAVKDSSSNTLSKNVTSAPIVTRSSYNIPPVAAFSRNSDQLCLCRIAKTREPIFVVLICIRYQTAPFALILIQFFVASFNRRGTNRNLSRRTDLLVSFSNKIDAQLAGHRRRL